METSYRMSAMESPLRLSFQVGCPWAVCLCAMESACAHSESRKPEYMPTVSQSTIAASREKKDDMVERRQSTMAHVSGSRRFAIDSQRSDSWRMLWMMEARCPKMSRVGSG